MVPSMSVIKLPVTRFKMADVESGNVKVVVSSESMENESHSTIDRVDELVTVMFDGSMSLMETDPETTLPPLGLAMRPTAAVATAKLKKYFIQNSQVGWFITGVEYDM